MGIEQNEKYKKKVGDFTLTIPSRKKHEERVGGEGLCAFSFHLLSALRRIEGDGENDNESLRKRTFFSFFRQKVGPPFIGTKAH